MKEVLDDSKETLDSKPNLLSLDIFGLKCFCLLPRLVTYKLSTSFSDIDIEGQTTEYSTVFRTSFKTPPLQTRFKERSREKSEICKFSWFFAVPSATNQNFIGRLF